VKKLWVSCSKFTIQVNIDDAGVIIWTAPIARKFIGQHIGALHTWMTLIAGGFKQKELVNGGRT